MKQPAIALIKKTAFLNRLLFHALLPANLVTAWQLLSIFSIDREINLK
jgi:hypothetical protein